MVDVAVAAVAAAQAVTMAASLKALQKQVRRLEADGRSVKKQKVAGSGHLSAHDLQKANLLRRIRPTLRAAMDRSKKGDEDKDVAVEAQLEFYFDRTTGAWTFSYFRTVTFETDIPSLLIVGVLLGDNPRFIELVVTNLMKRATKESWYTSKDFDAMELDDYSFKGYIEKAFVAAAKGRRHRLTLEIQGGGRVEAAKVPARHRLIV
jgi:hypothetical protein